MTFIEYKADPRDGTKSYRGINLTENQLFIPNQTSKEFIKNYKLALIAYDKEKKAIRLRLTNKHYNTAVQIRRGVSYAHYMPCRLVAVTGMPKGRYYVESHKKAEDKSGDYEIIFTHTKK